MDLSDEQKRFLELTDRFGRIRGLQNIRDLFGGRSEVQDQVGELEELGLVVREAYGVWSLTDKAFNQVVQNVRCEKCGKKPSGCAKNVHCDSTRSSYSVVIYEYL